MYENLSIIHWPDPRLKQPSKPVERFDDKLRLLSTCMLELMRQAKGVGLAAPQVGINVRLFVMNPTGQELDGRIYVNPVLREGDGLEEQDEGCLSLPHLWIKVPRSVEITLKYLSTNLCLACFYCFVLPQLSAADERCDKERDDY